MRKPKFVVVDTPITPKAARVFELMKRDGGVTRLTAMHAGIPNLTARIAELRAADVIVDCETHTDIDGNQYGRWSIAPSNGDVYVPRQAA
jgi:hypothetical protein